MSSNDRASFAPGEFIRGELEARGWTQESFAHILGRPLRTVNQILMGKRSITAQTAKEIAAAFGTSAELWMNLESAYRLSQDSKIQTEVERRAKLYSQAPIKEMIKRRWIVDSSNPDDLESALAEFFNVPAFAAAARHSADDEDATPPQRAWLCRAYRIAQKLHAKSFVRDKAIKNLEALHKLTSHQNELRHVSDVLSEMGIRFVLIEHLTQTKIDGAAFWLDPKSPVIIVTCRYDRVDAFWHTLAHELSHVLNGDALSVDSNLIGPGFIGYASNSEIEKRADQDASKFLIPETILDSFIARYRPRFSKVAIVQFANVHKIHPGIVVGQLQHRLAIKYSHSREMLVPVRKIISATAMTDGWDNFLAE